jgi:hypothetical protein
MNTIGVVGPGALGGNARAIFEAVPQREEEVFGARSRRWRASRSPQMSPSPRTYGEIRPFARDALGVKGLPSLWRAIGGSPHYREDK